MRVELTLNLDGDDAAVARRLRAIAAALDGDQAPPERADRDRPAPTPEAGAAANGSAAAAPSGGPGAHSWPTARMSQAMAKVLNGIHEAGGLNVHRADILTRVDVDAYGLGRSLGALKRGKLIQPRFEGSDTWSLTEYGWAVARGDVPVTQH